MALISLNIPISWSVFPLCVTIIKHAWSCQTQKRRELARALRTRWDQSEASAIRRSPATPGPALHSSGKTSAGQGEPVVRRDRDQFQPQTYFTRVTTLTEPHPKQTHWGPPTPPLAGKPPPHPTIKMRMEWQHHNDHNQMAGMSYCISLYKSGMQDKAKQPTAQEVQV